MGDGFASIGNKHFVALRRGRRGAAPAVILPAVNPRETTSWHLVRLSA